MLNQSGHIDFERDLGMSPIITLPLANIKETPILNLL